MEAGTKFISLLQDPFSAPANETGELHKLADRYPFSSSVQVLLAKILKEQGSFDTARQIKKAAVVSPNRKMLYQYLEQKITAQPVRIVVPELITETVQEEKIITSITEEKPEIIEQKPVEKIPEPVNEIPEKEIPVYFKNEETPVKEPEKQVFADQLEKIIQLQQPEQRFIKEIPKVKKEEAEEERPTEELIYKAEAVKHEPLEREILKEAIDKSIQMEVGNVQLPDTNSQETEEEPTEDTGSGFNYWLNPVANKEKGREKKLRQIDDLIDKFIKTEPKISPKKVEFFTAANAAKQSVELYEDLVSEPLAQIFEKQGYFDKAIKTYEKLSLKFPEKRTYFAARIEKIRDIIKNIKKEK